MRNFLTNIFLLVIGLVLVVFFVSNRQTVVISMDPFSQVDPAFAAQIPMWGAFAVSLGIGFGLGALGMWVSNGNLRRRAGTRKAEIRRLQRELEVLQSTPPEAAANEIVVRD